MRRGVEVDAPEPMHTPAFTDSSGEGASRCYVRTFISGSSDFLMLAMMLNE